MNKFTLKSLFNRRWIGVLFLIVGLSFLAYEVHHFWNVRLYNVAGLDVWIFSSHETLVAQMGEPDRQEMIREGVPSSPGSVFDYHYDGLVFRLVFTPRRADVVTISIYCPSIRLSGRDRLRVGSARTDVERALARPTRSRWAQNFGIHRAEYRINVQIDKWVNVTFYFDGDDAVRHIRIWPIG